MSDNDKVGVYRGWANAQPQNKRELVRFIQQHTTCQEVQRGWWLVVSSLDACQLLVVVGINLLI